mgnify:FL=1
MTETKNPDFTLNLAWKGGLRFDGESGETRLVMDGDNGAGPSPVRAAAFALAGCMAIDVVDVIVKGRFNVRSLTCDMDVHRAESVPRKIVAVDLRFKVEGDIPGDRVARAIELSREKYCSVWHSMNPAIDFKTSFTVTQ